MTPPPYADALMALMQKAGIADLEALSATSGLSGWQLARIQYGLLPKMPVEVLLQLAQTLQVPIPELVATLSDCSTLPLATPTAPVVSLEPELKALQQEYERLQGQLARQQVALYESFQQEVLAILEPWLLQWPTAAAAAQRNPQWPAVKLLPLMRPLANLLQQWQVEALATVGETVGYDPQWHQLLEDEEAVALGTPVVVRYIGYRRGANLLHRAQVSRVDTSEDET
jgi:hypothetical protein